MVHKLGVGKLGDCVYPYPTFAESFGHMGNYGYKPKYKLQAAEKAIKDGLKEYKD
jgi:hypothetical protein